MNTMKADPYTKQEIRSILLSGMDILQLTKIPESSVDKIVEYIIFFYWWNRRQKLSAISTIEEIIEKHFLDSLAILRRFAPHGRVVDIGPGAGFPSLPVKIARPDDMSLFLVEPSQKRSAFLKILMLKLGITEWDIGVHPIRIQDYKGEGFDWILSRATFKPDRLIELTSHLLNPNGRLLIMAGNLDLDKMGHLSKKAGLDISTYDSFTLPSSKVNRIILEIVNNKHFTDY